MVRSLSPHIKDASLAADDTLQSCVCRSAVRENTMSAVWLKGVF